MHLYAAETENNNLSEAARLLLKCALEDDYQISLPVIRKTRQGKPYFPDYPELHFSISHSGNIVLCALASTPCGCDVQEQRIVSNRLISRCFDQKEMGITPPLALWCLKESFIKYNGKMDRALNSMVFLPYSTDFYGPDNTFGRVFSLENDYYAAAVCKEYFSLPEKIRFISIEQKTS